MKRNGLFRLAETKGVLIGVDEPVSSRFLPSVSLIGSFKSFDDLRPMAEKPSRKRRFVRRVVSKKVWEKLQERPIRGIGTLPDGGLVSSVDAGFAGGAVSKSILLDDIDFKAAMRKRIGDTKLTTVGAIGAIRDGLAIVDEYGVLRCPPGTPGAMQFTNSRGEGCQIPNRNFIEPLERIDPNEFGQLDPAQIYDQVRIHQSRTNEDRTRKAGRRKKISENLQAGQAKPKKGKKPKKGETVQEETVPTTNINEIVKRAAGNPFSLDLVTGNEPTSGFVVARQGRGIIIPAENYLDKNGEPTPEATEAVLKFIAANADEFAGDPADGATQIVIGGWMSEIRDSDGNIVKNADGSDKMGIFFDISDVFPEGEKGKEAEAKALAEKAGKDRNQQAIFQLSTFEEWKTGGTGADVLPEEELDRAAGQGRARKRTSTATQKKKNRFVDLYGAIEGKDNMNLESFDQKQITGMLTKLKAVPGFEWVDPENPSHLTLAIDQGADNLFDLMDMTSEADREKSKRWYDIANEYARVLGEKYGVSEATASAVLAALSPTADWRNNVVTAEHVLALHASKEKLPDAFIDDLLLQLEASYKERNGKGAKSWDKLIAKNEKELAEFEEALTQENLTSKEISSLKSKIKGRKDNVKKFKAGKAADRRYTADELKGKSLSELPLDVQGRAVALHAQTIGGDFLGQEGMRNGDQNPGQILQQEVLFEEDFPDWDHDKSWKMSNRKNENGFSYRAMIQSLGNYESALAMIRSDQGDKPDWEVVDKEIGKGSKVRSFFNNIYRPKDEKYADITGDTHFFGGATMVPVSAKHKVLDALFTSNATGAGLAYPIFRAMVISAAKRWEEEKGQKLLPREIQSITWEAIRALVPDTDTSLKGWITNEMAQFMRLSSGPDPERPDLTGKGIEFLKELANAMQIRVTEQDTKRGMTLDKLRTEALELILKNYDLRPASGKDILPVSKKKEKVEVEE